jgi:hypothetical protein
MTIPVSPADIIIIKPAEVRLARASTTAAPAAQEALDAYGGAVPSYFIKPATRRERIAFSRRMTEAGANYPGDSAMRAALREGVRSLADAPEAGALVAVLDGIDALADAGEDVAPELVSQLDSIERDVMSGDRRYAQIVAARSNWMALAPLVAISMFCTGWENVAAPFRRVAGIIPDDVLDQIADDDDIRIVGAACISAFRVSETERKN